MKIWLRIILLTPSFALLVGCAGREAAQRTARLTIGQTLRLEEEINKKKAEEQKYYKNAAVTLSEAVERQAFALEQQELDRESQDFARRIIAADKTPTPSDLREFIEQSTIHVWTARSNFLAQGRAETQALFENLKKLEDKLAVLKEVRRNLEELQKEPDVTTRGQELIEFVKQVKEGAESKAPASDKGSGK